VLGSAALLLLSRAARKAPAEQRRKIRRGARLAEWWAPAGLFAVACLLSLGATYPHTALGPQLAGLAALVALGLGALPAGRS